MNYIQYMQTPALPLTSSEWQLQSDGSYLYTLPITDYSSLLGATSQGQWKVTYHPWDGRSAYLNYRLYKIGENLDSLVTKYSNPKVGRNLKVYWVPLVNEATTSSQTTNISPETKSDIKSNISLQATKQETKPTMSITSDKVTIDPKLRKYVGDIKDDLPYWRIPPGYNRYQMEKAINDVMLEDLNLQKKQLKVNSISIELDPTAPKYTTNNSTKSSVATASSTSTNKKSNKSSLTSKLKSKINNFKFDFKLPTFSYNTPIEKAISFYAYPTRHIVLYQLNPETFKKVLEKLSQEEKEYTKNSYYYTHKPLKKVPLGTEINDSTYCVPNNTIYHDSNGNPFIYVKDTEKLLKVTTNPNIVSPGDIISDSPVKSNQIPKNNKVLEKFIFKGDNDFYNNMQLDPTWHTLSRFILDLIRELNGLMTTQSLHNSDYLKKYYPQIYKQTNSSIRNYLNY